MKVFISWSGETSKNLAEALRQWLPAVIQAVKPYYSPDDISKGSRWGTEISKELEDSSVGIICLTRDNLAAPWIMFEAGALSKKFDKSKVCPILFAVDPTDIEGPLVQFQATKFVKDEVKKLVKMINAELSDRGLVSTVLDEVFEMWWPKLQSRVGEILESMPSTDDESLRSDRDLLQEILNLTRSTALATETQTRQARVNPLAVRDLVKTFSSVVLAASTLDSKEELFQALYRFRTPIDYLIRRAHLADRELQDMRRDFNLALEEIRHFLPSSKDDADMDSTGPIDNK